MKKKIFILTLILFITQIYGQSEYKRKQLAEEFLKSINIDDYIDNTLTVIEDSIFSQATYYFNQKKIDINYNSSVQFFKDYVYSQIAFINKNIKNRILFIYKNYNYAELQNIIRQIKTTHSTNNISEKIRAYNTVKLLIKEEIKELYDIYMPSYLNYIYKKQAPTKLVVTRNNIKVKPKSLDVLIIVDGYKTVSLLNKDKYTLSKPNNYENITEIVVVYNNQYFLFEPKPETYRLPKKLSDMKSPFSKYSFEKIPKWEIKINEDVQKTSITLINVEEFTTTINKK